MAGPLPPHTLPPSPRNLDVMYLKKMPGSLPPPSLPHSPPNFLAMSLNTHRRATHSPYAAALSPQFCCNVFEYTCPAHFLLLRSRNFAPMSLKTDGRATPSAYAAPISA